MNMGYNVTNDAHRLACFSCAHMSTWAPPQSVLCKMHILTEIPCTRDSTVTSVVFDEFWRYSTRLWYWIQTWITFELHLNQKNAAQSITFAKYDMQLASLGTSVCKCFLQIEKACFPKQWGKCVRLWCSDWCVCVFLNLKKKGMKMNNAQNFFLTIFFLCICVCWTWWIPQDGTTPLYLSAKKGSKQVVRFFLQNGAEVNASRKVIFREWKSLTQRNIYECIRNKMQSVRMALAMADCVEPMFHG